MKYSILVRGTDVKYIHQRGHTKENAERIAKLLNDAYVDDNDDEVEAIVMTDEEALAAMKEPEPDTSYFVVLEDGCVVFIEITPEMQNEIDTKYGGDETEYFQDVVCEEHNISVNNCEWSLTCQSCVSCYGKPIRITP